MNELNERGLAFQHMNGPGRLAVDGWLQRRFQPRVTRTA